MIDASGDVKRSLYSREDDSARRLWVTQRTKVNPWEHRAPKPEDESEPSKQPQTDAPVDDAPGNESTLIEQRDSLRLAVNDRPENPFAVLVLHRMNEVDAGLS